MSWLVPAIVAANLYVLASLRSIAVALLVAVAAALVSVHAVVAARASVATVKITAALFCPVSATVVVKVLLPQPLLEGLSVPETVKPGRVTVNLSPTARMLLTEKTAVKVVDWPQFWLEKTRDEAVIAPATMAGEVAIAVVGAFVAAAIVAATVRVLEFAACTAAARPVVMSALVVMVQVVAAASVAVATVNVTAALSVPLFATEAVNVLLAHP